MANKEEKKFDFGDYKKSALTRPRDLAWSSEWGQFKNVGDKISGFIRDVFYRKADGMFKEQRAFTIEQENGELINVGIKRLPFVLAQTDNLRIGDPLVIEFNKEIPNATKGFSPTKVMAFYGKNLPENTGKTVKELEHEDMIAGGTDAPEVLDEEAVKNFDKPEDIPSEG